MYGVTAELARHTGAIAPLLPSPAARRGLILAAQREHTRAQVARKAAHGAHKAHGGIGPLRRTDRLALAALRGEARAADLVAEAR